MKKDKNTSTKPSPPSQKRGMSSEELDEMLRKAFGEQITLEQPTKGQKPTHKGTSIDVTFIKHSGRKKTGK